MIEQMMKDFNEVQKSIKAFDDKYNFVIAIEKKLIQTTFKGFKEHFADLEWLVEPVLDSSKDEMTYHVRVNINNIRIVAVADIDEYEELDRLDDTRQTLYTIKSLRRRSR